MSVEKFISDNIDVWTSAIKNKSASGRGSSNKLELYGIKKLRELILELAVRGKLVPQDPNDEPASKLLEHIAAEKEQLIKDKKIKNQKQSESVSPDEAYFVVPNNWSWSRLSMIAEIGPRNDKIDDDSDTSFIPMPLISTSYDGRHGSETRKWREIKKGYTHFTDGDIGVAKITPCFENSKAAVFSGLINGVGAGTTELHIARPFTNTIHPNYVLLYLKSPIFLKNGESKMTGSAGQKRVPKDFFANNPFPLPPGDEQKRIVAKVDELMTLCDQLESQTEASIEAHKLLVKTLLETLTNAKDADELNDRWQRISEHFDVLFSTEDSIEQLKQTILQLAVMGKLVKQDPSDEPASKLLERIAAEKEQLIKDKKIKKQKPLPPIAEDEMPFDLPDGWEWCMLCDVSTIKGGKRLPKGHSLTTEPTPYIYIRVSDMKDGSIKEDDLHFIHEETRSHIENYIIESADIYMTIVGATIGKCGLVPPRFNGMNLTENAARIIIHGMVTKEFLHMLLDSELAQSQFIDKTKQVGVQKMALNRLASTKIALPPLNEQLRIVERSISLKSLCDELKTKLSQTAQMQMKVADGITSNEALYY